MSFKIRQDIGDKETLKVVGSLYIYFFFFLDKSLIAKRTWSLLETLANKYHGTIIYINSLFRHLLSDALVCCVNAVRE